MKKIIAPMFQIVILLAILYLFYINLNNISAVKYLKNGEIIEINSAIVIFSAYIAGLFSGMLQSAVNKVSYKNQIEFYARRNEKLTQQNEIDTDDKEALERKIATLEIALQNALKNK